MILNIYYTKNERRINVWQGVQPQNWGYARSVYYCEELIRGRSTMTSHILNKKQQFYKNKMRLMALKDIG